MSNDRKQEKESMAEFIAKKREMFLVQMSLDTKREEIRKLEEKARMKEEALRKSEQARPFRACVPSRRLVVFQARDPGRRIIHGHPR